mgnify:CR=1 FL=1
MINKNAPRIWRDTKDLNNFLGKKGKLVAYTTIYSAPSGFEHQVPYHVALVKFENGQTISCQIVDCSKKDLTPGLTVVASVRRIGMSQPHELIEYGLKVKPQK